MSAPRVTQLAPDPRRAGVVRVVLDGAPYGSVPRAVADRLGLVEGLELTPESLAQLEAEADAEAALRAALRQLERRAFATHDLRLRLVRRGHRPESAAAAVARLTGMGLLDDAAYARQYVAARAPRGRGPRRLELDLRALGVADQHIAAALAAHWPDGVDLLEESTRLARKRRTQLGALPPPVLRRRLLAYLGRRGFGGSDARRAVSMVLEAGRDH